MQAPRKPANERERQRALDGYQILDTAPELAFDDVVKLAAYICGTPVALISMVDHERQWFKARHGVAEDFTATPRELSFCGHMVYDGKPLVVNDALDDPRFADNPLVSSMSVRFYAGHPLTDENGHTLGSLCVIDQAPRELSKAQTDALEALARQVMAQIKFRREALKQRRLAAELEASQRLMKQYFTREDVWMGIAEYDGVTITQLFNNPRTEAYFQRRGLDPSRVGEADDYIPAKAQWFEAYGACARTKRMQTFDFEAAPEGVTLTLRATIHFVGLSEAGHAQMAFLVDDVTKVRADERLLDEQRQMVMHSAKLSALGEMAAGMAHEINNPLAIISGRAQEMRMTLERGGPTTKLIDSLASVDRTVERISKIIRGLRSFARDSGEDPMLPAKLDDILQDTLAFCTARFQAHGVRLEVINPSPNALVQCRSAEISQVFLNLLNNAHDAVAEGAAPRWVRLEVTAADPDGQVEIQVTDSGSGIPERIREKVMQPFFTTKPVNQGTGLGLSISKGIVETHGGTLTIDGACANTRFVVRLPHARTMRTAA